MATEITITHLISNPDSGHGVQYTAECDPFYTTEAGYKLTNVPAQVDCFMCIQASGIDPDEPRDPKTGEPIDQ